MDWETADCGRERDIASSAALGLARNRSQTFFLPFPEHKNYLFSPGVFCRDVRISVPRLILTKKLDKWLKKKSIKTRGDGDDDDEIGGYDDEVYYGNSNA